MKAVDKAISLSLGINHHYQTLQNMYDDKLQYIEKLKSNRSDVLLAELYWRTTQGRSLHSSLPMPTPKLQRYTCPLAQIATFIPDWNKINQALISGKMDKEEYDMWLEDTLKLFPSVSQNFNIVSTGGSLYPFS